MDGLKIAILILLIILIIIMVIAVVMIYRLPEKMKNGGFMSQLLELAKSSKTSSTSESFRI